MHRVWNPRSLPVATETLTLRSCSYNWVLRLAGASQIECDSINVFFFYSHFEDLRYWHDDTRGFVGGESLFTFLPLSPAKFICLFLFLYWQADEKVSDSTFLLPSCPMFALLFLWLIGTNQNIKKMITDTNSCQMVLLVFPFINIMFWTCTGLLLEPRVRDGTKHFIIIKMKWNDI